MTPPISESPVPVVWEDVAAAADRIKVLAHRTPVMTSRQIDGRCGGRVFFKCENFQRAGAFKFRGAANALSRLDAAQRARGALTYSSGNHAQALALAGSLLGVPTTIIMPRDAPAVKLAATRAYGAEVIEYDKHQVTREELGARISSERGLPIIPPYDHPDVIAGQGTAAKELIEDAGDLDFLFVCLGGGGLLSGCAIAARHLLPRCKVIGVEPAAADDAARSFRTGELHTVHHPDTVADGARTPSLGRYTFPLVRRHVDDIITVDDSKLLRAMFLVWERMKIVIEPTGALALAGILSGKISLKGARVGAIFSGGNVDLSLVPEYRRLAGLG